MSGAIQYPANPAGPPIPFISGCAAAAGAGSRCGGLDRPKALVISLLAAGLAGWARRSSSHPEPAAIGNPAVADAKGQACSAFFW